MLVAAGAGALTDIVPLTLVITAMLVLLVVSYTQVIAAHPEGGGAYAVAKRNLGAWPSLLAAASLVVDYVLTVAVSLAAGAASLGSVFPGALAPPAARVPDRPGAADGGEHVRDHRVGEAADGCRRAVFIDQHVRGDRRRGVPLPSGRADRQHPSAFPATEALGFVLLLKAFAAGCSAVTGVEAIANGVPAFREPRVRSTRSAPSSRSGCCSA